MFDNIVIAVDEPEEMEAPLRVAVDIADKYGGVCYPVHVVDLPENPSIPEYYEVESGSWEETRAEIERRGGELCDDICSKLSEMAKEIGVDIRCLCRVGTGPPSETVIELSNEVDADLIVVGVRRREGLDRILHQSVSGEIVESADVPVLSVRA